MINFFKLAMSIPGGKMGLTNKEKREVEEVNHRIGMVTVSSKAQIAIPKKIIRLSGIKEGEKLLVTLTDENAIILQRIGR